ncbi:MAG: hypothetical protein KDC43_29705 [Saprospiraceae bacterium]|nr:hypothetical protein [Saprospiraceae bacterium]
MKYQDPKILVTDALLSVDGNQAALGRMLGISRVSVNEWVTTGRKYLPALQAYRYLNERKNAA